MAFFRFGAPQGLAFDQRRPQDGLLGEVRDDLKDTALRRMPLNIEASDAPVSRIEQFSVSSDNTLPEKRQDIRAPYLQQVSCQCSKSTAHIRPFKRLRSPILTPRMFLRRRGPESGHAFLVSRTPRNARTLCADLRG